METQISTQRWSFTQGFLFGQLSVVVLVLLAIRFIIFEDSKTAKSELKRPSSLPLRSARKRTKSSAAHAQITREELEYDVATIMNDVLSKVDYEMDSHFGESIDWINVLFGQAIAGYRQDIFSGGWSAEDSTESTAREWMQDILNVNTIDRGMKFLDPIKVIDVEFGENFPIFSNAKIRPADDMGRIRVEADVDYTDCVSLSIETKLLINFPRPRFAVLPISLGLTIERFSGTIAVELSSSNPLDHPQKSTSSSSIPKSRHELHFSLHPDFALDATATSLVGSKAKLQDLPKIEQLLIDRVRLYIHDKIVWPKYWCLTLPNLIPKRVYTGIDHLNRLPMINSQSENLQKEEEILPNVFHSPVVAPSASEDDHLPGSLPNSVEAWRSQSGFDQIPNVYYSNSIGLTKRSRKV